MLLLVLINICYLLILFRERGRKSAPAPDVVALMDARFGVAGLAIHAVCRRCAFAHWICSI